jgi:probable rRNA maturation factor
LGKEKIFFFSENIPFKLTGKKNLQNWILHCIKKESGLAGELCYIFCSDDYLLEMNKNYLNHQTLTDIITFDYTDEEGFVSGDIFISVDRVKENAKKFEVAFDTELHRVMIHGVLHLLGYKDKTAKDREVMRKKETSYLKLLHSIK